MIVIGLIVNPIAGMGGKVALKGTDGEAVLQKARSLGAVPEAPLKARRALAALLAGGKDFRILTCGGKMGEDSCRLAGVPCEVVFRPESPEESSAKDTREAVKALRRAGAEIIAFAGGDGTARDILDAAGSDFPVLGIPAGVKIQSAVFALTPETAGQVLSFLSSAENARFEQREVADLDEEAYRNGHVSASLYGTMLVPDKPETLQDMKQSGFGSDEGQLLGAAQYLEENMDPDLFYAVGSGTSAKCICRYLGIDGELLGVDVIRDKKLVKKDCTAAELESFAGTGKLRIIVSFIGGQGFVFGRGNHQFSPEVLKRVGKEGITVVAPLSKLISVEGQCLRMDIPDPEVKKQLEGYYQVLAGYGYRVLLPCR